MALAAITTCFSGNPLNRADHLRTDPEIFGAYLHREDTRIILMAEDQILSDEMGNIAWYTYSQCRFLPTGTTVFLGLDDTAPRYAIHLQGTVEDFDNIVTASTGPVKFRDGRNLGFKLTNPKTGEPHPSLGIIAQAKSMLLWHESHRFCAKCGAKSALSKAGYERTCKACNTSHFPRTDPVVIMLICNGDKALVGRGIDWPEGSFSALAGYVEPGESIEEAVAREIFEEVGITTTKVRYIASQPWPWPSSLMIGAMAWTEDTELTIDSTELAEAIWVSKEDVIASMAEDHPLKLLPPPYAIAHNLMKHWLESE